MKKTSRVSRRSFVGLISGGAMGVMVAPRVKAQETGRTDSDAGGDISGYGRTGNTDRDPVDRAGYGRTNITDADASDRTNYGCGNTSITDCDTGASADGRGRTPGQSSGRSVGVTDADSGSNADAVGRGRGNSNGIADSDPSDGSGRGYSGATDSDSVDRAGHGRGLGTGR